MTRRARSRRRGHGRATLEDVARQAGVSTITVSRSIRSPELVAETTRRRIDDAIAEIGYIPNLVAGNLASNESHSVAAIVPTLDNSIFAEMLQGMVEVLDARDYQLLLGSNGYDLDEEEKLVRAFLSRQVEGLILTGASRTARTRTLLERSGVPVVETWSLLGEPSAGSVGFSNYDAAHAMVRHLHGRGYRRLGFVSAPIGNNDRAAERRRGFTEAVRELGLDLFEDAMLTSFFGLRAGAQALTTILQRRPVVDAIFFANDTLAAGAVLEAQRAGIAVPERVALAGFDDLEIASQVSPGLTTVRIHRRALGTGAAQLVLDTLDGAEVAQRRQDLGFEIVAREST